MLNHPNGAEKGKKSEVGVRYDVEEDGGDSGEEHPGVFFPRNAFNEIQQSLDDHLSQTLTPARDQLHLGSEEDGQTYQHGHRKP